MTDSNLSLQQSHEPQLLRELREKSVSVNMRIQKLTSANRNKHQNKAKLQSQLKKLKEQTQVQVKKNRSLIVLLNELQNSYHSGYLQLKNKNIQDESSLSLQNQMIRYLLIKKTENIKQNQKFVNFLKLLLLDKQKGKAKEFIKKSNFIESQSELMAKLSSQISLLKNQSLQCKRKWCDLQEETLRLESRKKLFSIQKQRQKVELKSLYQEYLQKINESKMRIVSYNQTQKQSIINEYLVKQMAVLQAKRVEIEDENNNLLFHHQNLGQQMERLQIENKQLGSFFNQNNQQSVLASKMKKRIEQLRDVLIEYKKKNKNTRGNKIGRVLENAKSFLHEINQSNDYVELKTRQQQNYGSLLEEQPIAQFFSKVLEQKDKSIDLLKRQEEALTDKIKEIQTQKGLLTNQLSILQQNLDINSWQTNYAQSKNWGFTRDFPSSFSKYT